jgi:tetratricopeptide (TPR) repeat protein
VPPMLLSFIVPITDRYLFLPSVGFCILLVQAAVALDKRWLPAHVESPANQKSKIEIRKFWLWTSVASLCLLWSVKTSAYIAEWADPRSVWYGAHLKTKDTQVAQFLGQLYQDNGERVDDFIKSGAMVEATNQLRLAAAVLHEPQRVESLRAEWLGQAGSRTNSIIYRDRLWALAWEQFEASVATRGMLSTPNLYMCRGRLLVREGKFAQAIPEFRIALRLADASHYQRVRYEGVTHALYAIGVAYWDMGNYREAQPWLVKAQEVQRASGQIWIGSLDKDVERIQILAASQ